MVLLLMAYPVLAGPAPHSPAQLGVSPSRPRRPGCTPRAASGHPCGVTRSIATGGFGVAAPPVGALARRGAPLGATRKNSWTRTNWEGEGLAEALHPLPLRLRRHRRHSTNYFLSPRKSLRRASRLRSS